MPVRPVRPLPNLGAAENPRVITTLPCIRRYTLRPTNARNDEATLRVSGNGFRVVSGAVGADLIFPSSPGMPLDGPLTSLNPNALSGISNGEWYPVCFDRLDYLWVDDHGTLAPTRPVVIEVAIGGHAIEGVAGMGAGAFWEEHLTRGNEVSVGNAAGGYVIYSDNPAATPMLQAGFDELGRAHWHKRPHLSYRGTIDGHVASASGDDFQVGFFAWDGTAMKCFRVLNNNTITFASETTEGQMCISPAPVGGFEIRLVSATAGAVDLSWAFGVRGGMRL